MKTLPRLNISYWLLMLMCTTMGELIGNLISRNFELGYTQGAILDVVVFAMTIAIILAFKFRNEAFYWILILMGNIGGTNLADWVTLEPLPKDKTWGLLQPLELGTKMGSLAVMCALILVLVVRAIVTRKKATSGYADQVLYWLAILLSSTFGTTSGDLITNDTPLGAFGGSLALIALLIVVYAGYRAKIISRMTGYWAALVLMHPVGATIGNYVSKPIGLNLGNVYTNVALILLFVIVYLADGRVRSTVGESTGEC